MKKDSRFFDELKILRKRLPKSFVAGFLVAALVLSVLIFDTSASSSNQPPAGFTAIRTAADLRAIGSGSTLSARNASLARNYWLANDIDISGLNWDSIGSFTEHFTGIFEGNGHTISGLWSSGQGSNQGLFARINGNNAIVRNLNIEVDSRGITGSGERKGALAGNVFAGATVDNVHVKGAAGRSPISGGASYIGGITGDINKGTIRNSSVENINLSGGSYIGGISGFIYNGGRISNSSAKNLNLNASASYVGGLIGAVNNGIVSDSSVENAVLRAGASYAGGFMGYAYADSVTTGITPTIISNNTVRNIDVEANTSYVGGFAGGIKSNFVARLTSVTEITVDTAKVRAGVSYAGGFSGVIYFLAQISDVTVNNPDVRTGTGGWAGGFVGTMYDPVSNPNNNTYKNNVTKVSDARVTNPKVSARWAAGGFLGELAGYAFVERAYVFYADVEARDLGAGGFAGIIYHYSQVTQSGVISSNVTSISGGNLPAAASGSAGGGGIMGTGGGGFAGAIHGLGVRVYENFAENTNVRGTSAVGGFVGHLAATNNGNNNYANGWARPPAHTDANGERRATPGPRPGLSHWRDDEGRMIPASVTGSGDGVGGFVGTHQTGTGTGTTGLASRGILNGYAAIEVNGVTNSGRGAFTGAHPTLNYGKYFGTSYFDDLSSDEVISPSPFPGAVNPIPTFYRVLTPTSQANWRGDSRGTDAANFGVTSLPQARITDVMVLRDTFFGWEFHRDPRGGPWHIEEGISYPYFLIGVGEGYEPDWERLRHAINDLSPSTIHIFPYGSPQIENLADGILVIQDTRAPETSNYFINSTVRTGGRSSDPHSIVVTRSVTIVAAHAPGTAVANGEAGEVHEKIELYTRIASAGRHFIVQGNGNINFGFNNVILDGSGAAGGIAVEHNSSRTVALSGAEIQNCYAEFGGGVFASFGGTLQITNSVINSNVAVDGGGIWNLGTLTLNGGNELRSNTATHRGGGIWNGDKFTMNNGIISGNSTEAAIDEFEEDIDVEDDEDIIDNIEAGGGVYNTGTFAMVGGTISGNTAARGGGVANGGTFAVSTDATLGNNTSTLGIGSRLWNSGRLYGIEAD